MNDVDEVTRDRDLRLVNQRTFPLSFVDCQCDGGCLLCAYTGLVSRAERKQMRQRHFAAARPGALL